MTIQTVYLINCPQHQVSNSQYAISGLTSYIVKTITNVNTINNLSQTIRLPWDSSYDSTVFNIVKFANGMIYDVVGVRESTTSSHSLEIDIEFNPVSSYLTAGITVSGYFERTPTEQNKALTINVYSDSQTYSRCTEFTPIPNPEGFTPDSLFVVLTAKFDITTGTTSELKQYGWFCSYSPHAIYNNYLGSWHYYYDGTHYYPNLLDTINNIDEITGIPASSIVDVSISKRCPFRYSVTGGHILLKNYAGTDFLPTTIGSSNFGIYHLGATSAGISEALPETVTITLTDFERQCGEIYITDEMQNKIFKVPNEYFATNNILQFYVYPTIDITGMYTQVKFNNMFITIPESKLPWIGDNWKDYLATSYNYDKQMLNNQIKYTRESYETDRNVMIANGVSSGVQSAMMGVLTGGVMGKGAGAVAGGSVGLGGDIASTVINYYASKDRERSDIKNLKANQLAQENLIKSSPASYFNTSYGLDYCFKSYYLHGAGIRIEVPKNISSTDLSNFVSYYGYPCNKYASFALSAGYIKGNINSTISTTGYPAFAGVGLDLLRKEIANGVRLVAL